MIVDLMAYRRNLCRAMAGLVGEEWHMVVRLINRIDQASKATVRFVITAQLEELMEAADSFEELAVQIRRVRNESHRADPSGGRVMSQKKGAKGGCPRIAAEPHNANLLPNPFRNDPSGWIARKARKEVIAHGPK